MTTVVEKGGNGFNDTTNVVVAVDPNTALLTAVAASLAGTLDVKGNDLKNIDKSVGNLGDNVAVSNFHLESIASQEIR